MKSKQQKSSDIERAIKIIEGAGGKVRLPVALTRKTFVVEDTLLNEFMAAVRKSNLKIQDAVAEALTAWMRKNGGR